MICAHIHQQSEVGVNRAWRRGETRGTPDMFEGGVGIHDPPREGPRGGRVPIFVKGTKMAVVLVHADAPGWKELACLLQLLLW